MRRDHTKRLESDQVIYRALIATILPVILSTVIYNISTIIDQEFSGNYDPGKDIPRRSTVRSGEYLWSLKC